MGRIKTRYDRLVSALSFFGLAVFVLSLLLGDIVVNNDIDITGVNREFRGGHSETTVNYPVYP